MSNTFLFLDKQHRLGAMCLIGLNALILLSSILFGNSNNEVTYTLSFDSIPFKGNYPKVKLKPHLLNLDSAKLESLLELGLNQAIAKRLLNYNHVLKGKMQYKHLQKLYGIDKAQLAILSKYLVFNAQPIETKQEKHLVNSNKVNLNTADSLELSSAFKFYPSLVHRILKYRNMLHGFVSINQIEEVYGIKPEQASFIKSRSIVNPIDAKQWPSSCDSLKVILKHPYLWDKSRKEAVKLACKCKTHVPGEWIYQLDSLLDANKLSNLKQYFNIP